nr:MAG TPA: hypothetical protein [Caudoviricetes sp.]
MPNTGHRSSCWGQRPKTNGSNPLTLCGDERRQGVILSLMRGKKVENKFIRPYREHGQVLLHKYV